MRVYTYSGKYVGLNGRRPRMFTNPITQSDILFNKFNNKSFDFAMETVISYFKNDPKTLGRFQQICRNYRYCEHQTLNTHKRIFKVKKKYEGKCNEYSPFIEAAGDGNFADVRILLMEEGVDINQVCGYDKSTETTALLLAIEGGRTEVVKLLVRSKNIDVNKPNAHGWTPLYMASKRGNAATFNLLKNHGAKIALTGVTPCDPTKFHTAVHPTVHPTCAACRFYAFALN